jgi:hypothetical protein
LAVKTEIRLRRSNNTNAIPTAENLGDGEMAMNTADGALYFKKSDDTIITAHDDTIMHIDSTNDAVDVAGDLNIAGDTVINSGSLTAGEFTFPTTGAGTRKIMMYPGGGNRLFWGNLDIDDIDDADRTLARVKGWVPGFNNNVEDSVIWSTSEDAVQLTPNAGGVISGLSFKAFKVKAGEKINITVPVKATTTGNIWIYAYQYDGVSLPLGKTHVSNSASYSLVQEESRQYTIVENNTVSSSWTQRSGSFTAEADGWVSIGIYVATTWDANNRKLYIKDPDIKRDSLTVGDVIGLQYLLG